MSSSKRRIACPQTVLHIWESIGTIRQQKQVPSLDRIAQFVKRNHNIALDDVERQVNFAVRDGLLHSTRKVGNKGSKVGYEQDSYIVIPKNLPRDGHDWYCHECHRGGDVLSCTDCHRVYHPFCVKEDQAYGCRFTCLICKMCKSKSDLKIKKHDLNVLLGYACNRLKEKQSRDIVVLPQTTTERWKYENLIFFPMDLSTMDKKVKDRKYNSVEEFHADALSIVHNVIVFYGGDRTMVETAQHMLRDCIYDLGEIRQCKDCYRMSNVKINKHWFCQPCKPPHELVYAKQKGFPFWPAKVIRKTNGVFDVRFFGGSHQRANISKQYIKPIGASNIGFPGKRTVLWNRACEELARHQDLLAKMKRDASDDEIESEMPSPKRLRSMDVSSEIDEEMSITSTSKTTRKTRVTNNEDYNVVSSSSPDTASTRVSVAVQTLKVRGQKSVSKATQTDAADIIANCARPSGRPQRKQTIVNKEQSLADLEKELRIKFQKEKEKAIHEAAICSKQELDKLRKSVELECLKRHQLEMKLLTESHRRSVSETKKKQWCYNCEAEAIYHCCWNTSYCSHECQQVHWQLEHKRSCRRKR